MSARFLLALLVFLCPRPASAQECTDPAAAQEAFDSGRTFAATRELTAARDAYARSLALCPRVPAAYNLAVVYRQLGAPLEARRLLRELLTGAYGDVPGSQEEVIQGLIGDVMAEIGVIEVVVRGAEQGVVTVDGRELGPIGDAASRRAEVVPGRRIVRASSADGRHAEVATVVEPGATVEARLELPPPIPTGRLLVTGPSEDAMIEVVGVGRAIGRFERQLDVDRYVVRLVDGDDSRTVDVLRDQTARVDFEPPRSIFASPWFWLVTGLLVAGGATVGVYLAVTTERAPVADATWGRVDLALF
jgi:hypothetical protein